MESKRSTDWFMNAKWGAFGHYLLDQKLALDESYTPDDWNRQIDAIDVDILADQLARAGVGYYFMTVGQNTGYYCAPNAVYDSFVGRDPSRCSKRDLIGDVADALAKKGIPMLAYVTSGAPVMDLTAIEKLEWEWGKFGGHPHTPRPPRTEEEEAEYRKMRGTRTMKRLAEFQNKWERILAYYSNMWGKRILGWWVDGCYFTDEMYNHPDTPNFKSFCDSMRAGNPDALVSLNPGVFAPVKAVTEEEDYTAGEIDRAFPIYRERYFKGEQYHILSYIGKWWGHPEIDLSPEFVSAYTREVNRSGGVVTWDVPISPEGMIPDHYIDFLTKVGKEIKR